MYQSLDLFQTAGAMAQHAGQRQAIVARNIANADTPGYRAQQIAPFADVYSASAAAPMRATRASHIIAAHGAAPAARPTDTSTETAPNGNAVSLEEELLASVAVAREHSRALAIYQHGMTILRSALGRG
jgi:flagellar basal-body rod protein FlgB